MTNRKYVLVQKVPLEELIKNLTELWEQNLDFIDIGVTIVGEKVTNSLDLIGRDAYLSEEAQRELKNNPPEDKDIDYLNDIDEII